MVTRHVYEHAVWVDLEAPTEKELQTIMEEFGIHKKIEDEIISPTPYPLFVSSTRYQYLILHFPTTNPLGGAKNQEVDFIVGKDFLITARYEVIESIYNLHKIFEAEELLGVQKKGTTVEHLLEHIFRHLYGTIREQTERTVKTIDTIEESIFSGKEREMVTSISMVARILLRFDSTLMRHTQPLDEFLQTLEDSSFFGKEFHTFGKHIKGEHAHTASLVASYRTVVGELRKTNDSLLTASQNDVIKRLTILTFVIFPLSVIASLFGISSKYIPFMNSPYGFYVVLGMMAISVTLFLFYFFYKKWL
jgi:magnesium transporter